MTADGRILLVDDEALVLGGLTRQLGRRYDLVTADSAQAALVALDKQGPIAVIISDYRMPEMDGLQLLAAVRERYPRVIRCMLTGEADMRVVIDAVNTGEVFRFLTKPCQPNALAQAIEAALRQWRLEAAERDLLERTLTGSVRLVTEMLGLADPPGFARVPELRDLVRRVGQLPGIELWALELAAVLADIGMLTLPPIVRDRQARGLVLTDDEVRLLAKVPGTSAELLSHIPRLQPVVGILRGLAEGSAEPAVRLLDLCRQLQEQRGRRATIGSYGALPAGAAHGR
jgi:response regulator RpfG family c-di-GMP phosphodiesterase